MAARIRPHARDESSKFLYLRESLCAGVCQAESELTDAGGLSNRRHLLIDGCELIYAQRMQCRSTAQNRLI